MACIQLVSLLCLILLSETAAQSTATTAPTCSGSNLQLTPSLRQKILDEINGARQTVKNGQMLLMNGKYALPAEDMNELTWNCDKEEEIHQYFQAVCDAYPFQPTSTPIPDLTWNHFAETDDTTDNVAYLETGFNSGKFGILTSFSLAHDTYYVTPYGSTLPMYYDKAETVGCALFKCDVRGKPSGWGMSDYRTYISCAVDRKPVFGEQLYEVAASATNYIPPTQDLICPFVFPTPTVVSVFNVELRQMIMTKINEIRSAISAGTYELQNGNIALTASNLNNLEWSCDEEAAIAATLSTLSCDNALYDPATEFQTIAHPTTFYVMPDDIKVFVNQLIDEYFVSNPNFNFLSGSTTYSSQYPAAFALSDQATSFACNVKYCFTNPGSQPDYHFICRAKPATPITGTLYQV